MKLQICLWTKQLCNGKDNLGCEDNFGSTNSFEFIPTRGIEYHFHLTENSFYAVGAYEFKIKQYDQLQNDFCENAVAMTKFPFIYQGDLKGVTPDLKNKTVSCGSGWSGVWFSFLGTGYNFGIEMKTVDTDEYFLDKIALFEGSCDNLVCVTSKDGSGVNAIVSFDVTTTVGAPYLVFVAADDVQYDKISYFTVSKHE